MDHWVGKTLSKVEIREPLGRGAMGQVYLGHHTTLDKAVAVKVLLGFLVEEEQMEARFRREAQAVAAMRHPNILQVYDFDLFENTPYIVMEWVNGVTLEDHLTRVHEQGRTLPPETSARLIGALASALDYAHYRGVIHRDLKPANIMLRKDEGEIIAGESLSLDVDVVLMDFGLARLNDQANMTASGGITGTPAYISPEQARGQPVDRRSDNYALGVILYEMLAGHAPFSGEDDNVFSLIMKHVTEMPEPIAGLDPALQMLLDKALAKDPQERYLRAGQMVIDLLAVIFSAGTTPMQYEKSNLPLAGLLETLHDLLAQAQAYERAVPPSNAQARLMLARLGEIARRAFNEAEGLKTAFETPIAREHPFSPRERECLQLAAGGLTNKEIAYRLGITERTVEFHMKSVFSKTTTSSRTEAVALAISQKWIEPSL